VAPGQQQGDVPPIVAMAALAAVAMIAMQQQSRVQPSLHIEFLPRPRPAVRPPAVADSSGIEQPQSDNTRLRLPNLAWSGILAKAGGGTGLGVQESGSPGVPYNPRPLQIVPRLVSHKFSSEKQWAQACGQKA
jgi:hypothetical protein